jgi:hypothetical protein
VAAHVEATDWILSTIENKTANPDNYTNLLAMGAAFSGRNATVVAASLEHMTLLYAINDELKDYLVDFTNQFIDLNQTTSAAVTARGYDNVTDFSTPSLMFVPEHRGHLEQGGQHCGRGKPWILQETCISSQGRSPPT